MSLHLLSYSNDFIMSSLQTSPLTLNGKVGCECVKECRRAYQEDILIVGVYRWLCKGGKGEGARMSVQG